MKSPVDISKYSIGEKDLEVGTISAQYSFFRFVDFFERPVCEHFYADQVAQRELKERRFDLLLSDCLHQFSR